MVFVRSCVLICVLLLCVCLLLYLFSLYVDLYVDVCICVVKKFFYILFMYKMGHLTNDGKYMNMSCECGWFT